jgi:hypothetical protein
MAPEGKIQIKYRYIKIILIMLKSWPDSEKYFALKSRKLAGFDADEGQ